MTWTSPSRTSFSTLRSSSISLQIDSRMPLSPVQTKMRSMPSPALRVANSRVLWLSMTTGIPSLIRLASLPNALTSISPTLAIVMTRSKSRTRRSLSASRASGLWMMRGA